MDKTSFIEQWWESSYAVTLITRPRRFGKTLNLSMMECFFSTVYCGRTELFDGLKIWQSEKLSENDRNIIESMSTGIDEYKALTAIKMLSGIRWLSL